jgi:sugar lactone lactonase YvrE
MENAGLKMKAATVALACAIVSACAAPGRTPIPGAPDTAASAPQAASWNVTTLFTGWSGPFGMAFDGAGDAFVTDSYHNAVYELDTSGSIRTLARNINLPTTVAVDKVGNAYVTFSDSFAKIAQNGTVTKLGLTPCEGLATAASAGTVYVADPCTGLIYKVAPSGRLTRLRPRFSAIFSLAGDPNGNLYVSRPDAIFRVQPDGKVKEIVAGMGGRLAADTSGDVYFTYQHDLKVVDPNGSVRTFRSGFGYYELEGIAVDAAGHLYGADIVHGAVYRVPARGPLVTIGFSEPVGVAVDRGGNAYVTVPGNNAIYKVSPGGMIATIAGGLKANGVALDSAENVYASVGTSVLKISPSRNIATVASGFSQPQGVAVDTKGNIYVADSGAYAVKKVSPSGVVRTIFTAGSQTKYLGIPSSVAVDSSGTVYVGDALIDTRYPSLFGAVYAVAPDGNVSAIGGTSLPSPEGVAVGAAGSLYVTNGGVVVEISPHGQMSCVTGQTPPSCTGSRWKSAVGIAIDPAGAIYVGDDGTGQLVRVSPQPIVYSTR